jgi:hypothetical protein
MIIEYDTLEQFNKEQAKLADDSLVFIHETKKLRNKINGEWLEFLEEEISCEKSA